MSDFLGSIGNTLNGLGSFLGLDMKAPDVNTSSFQYNGTMNDGSIGISSNVMDFKNITGVTGDLNGNGISSVFQTGMDKPIDIGSVGLFGDSFKNFDTKDFTNIAGLGLSAYALNDAMKNSELNRKMLKDQYALSQAERYDEQERKRNLERSAIGSGEYTSGTMSDTTVDYDTSKVNGI